MPDFTYNNNQVINIKGQYLCSMASHVVFVLGIESNLYTYSYYLWNMIIYVGSVFFKLSTGMLFALYTYGLNLKISNV